MTHDLDTSEHNAAEKNKPAKAPLPKRRRKNELAWLEEPYNHTRGEMSLWVAVITQAMMDALSRSRDAEALYYKTEAIHWLTENSRDFILVCLNAGFDPDYVRRQAKRTMLKPVAWRAAAGKGSRYLERLKYRKRVANPPMEKKSCEYKSCESQGDCAGSNVVVLRSGFAARRT